MSTEKKRVHFNFIDILIILAFVVLVVGFSYYANGNWQTNSARQSGDNNVVRYTLHADNISEGVAKLIKVGDTLKDASKDTEKGEIVKINYIEKYINKEAFDSEKGEYIAAEHPKHYSADFVVESAYSLSGQTITIDDMELKIGKKNTYKADNYALNAVIVSIDEIKN